MIRKKLKEIFEESLGIDERDYTFESDLRNELDLDSLDLLEIIMKVEKEFNVSIPDDAVVDIRNLEDLTNYVNGHIK